jgi:purine-binding chemotaxis protein CheW
MIAVSPLPQAPPHTLGVINFHHTVVPVLDLRCRFGLPACVYGLTAHLLLARTPRRTLALPVDEVLGVRNVATTAISVPSAVLPGITQIAGMVALADGLLFIYDLDSVLSLEEEQQLTGALEDIGPCT